MILFTALGYWSDAVAQVKAPMDGKTSSFIEQILSSVRIVQSFDMAPKLLRKLQNSMLAPLRKVSAKTSATRALEQAAAYGAGFLVYSLSFWYGGIQVADGLSVGNFLTVSTCRDPAAGDQDTDPRRHSTITSTCSSPSLPSCRI